MAHDLIPKTSAISIIVPLYNKANSVAATIDSIFAQTVQNFELLVIDGGSTDGSLDVIKRYESDSRYHLINQKSKGLPAARNEAIAVASNSLVAFLDADDVWCSTFLEMILVLREKYPNAGLYATAYATSYGENIITKPKNIGIPDAPWSGIIESYFRSSALTFRYPFSPCCVAIPKTTFDKTGLFNERLSTGEDSEMWGRIALDFPIAFDSSIGAVYSEVAENRMTDNPKVLLQHPFVDFIKQYPKDTLKRHPDYQNIMLYLQKEDVAMALNNLYAGNPKQARLNLKRVTDKTFSIQKMGLLVISYMPSFVRKRVLPIANRHARQKIQR